MPVIFRRRLRRRPEVANQMGGQASRIAKLIDTCVELEEKRKNEKSETFLDGDLIAFEGTSL